MHAMSCQRDHNHMFLWRIIVLLASYCICDMVLVVDGALVIVNHSGRDMEAECGPIRGIIRANVRAVAPTDLELGLVDGNLDKKLELVTSSSSNGHCDRRRRSPQTCRVEAGNCFLTWEIDPADYEYLVGENNVEWEVDEKGVVLLAQSRNSESNARSKVDDPGRNLEYRMLWQPSNQLLSSTARCMCAPPTSPLAQAFYSILLYFRE